MNVNFYDIESLSNVFTLANYQEKENNIELYYLCDDDHLVNVPRFAQRLMDRIYEKNHNFGGTLTLYNLKDVNGLIHLGKRFGISDSKLVNNPAEPSTFGPEFRPVCDTDPEYIANPDKYPYFAGYNSANYDTTILAYLFAESLEVRTRNADIGGRHTPKKEITPRVITAKQIRNANDELFTKRFKDCMPTYLACEQRPNGTWSQPNYQRPAWRIRKNMLLTGRQIDVSNLNEKLRKVGLKRLLGMMGYQILESDKLGVNNNTIENTDQLLDLIAYNISDVVNLKEIFYLKFYQGQFTLKRQLLHTYPELIYDKLPDKYAPDIRPEAVRKDRLYIDSTSSQLAQKALCPYNHLKDIPAVSFMYPHPEKAKELGIKSVNVLEEAKNFFYSKFPQPHVRAQFDNIYNYYKSIEGKNFNASQAYKDDFGNDALIEHSMSEIPKMPNCIPYFDKDGNPTSCFVTFSTGGVHGAEYNKELYEFEKDAYTKLKEDFDYVKNTYRSADWLKNHCGTKPKTIQLPNGVEWTTSVFNKAAKTLLALSEGDIAELTQEGPLKGKVKQNMRMLLEAYKCDFDEIEKAFNDVNTTGVPMPDGRLLPVNFFLKPGKNANGKLEFKDISKSEPVLFKTSDDNSLKLNPKYVFTSAAKANHEDFTSYYPNLLRMMMAFFNAGLGYDRYAEVFDQKQDYGFLMKKKNEDMRKAKDKLSPKEFERCQNLRKATGLTIDEWLISDEERELYAVLREGTKLILNSASGAGDATFDNNIRVNNQIISMRIIGQLFSWRIGQAQSFQGAKIISTNTDGLYSVMEATINDKILAEESADIGVEIEPEPLYLISKDTNNRIEADADTMNIIGASGGTLGCRKGPVPTKSLAHPAIIDWALAEYLTVAAQGYKGLSLDKPFNATIGMNILQSAIYQHDAVTWLRMFQNVLASSTGSVRYIYGITDDEPTKPIILPHYNRVFYMKDHTPNTIHLWTATARVIGDATKKKRAKTNDRPVYRDPIPVHVLLENGVSLPMDKDITTVKVTGIEDKWYAYIQNKNLNLLTTEEYQFILNNLDYDKYLELLKDAFENNWRNHLPNRNYIQFMNLGECIATETLTTNQTANNIAKPDVINAYNFVEWNTAPDGTGQTLTDDLKIVENMIVYAIYQTTKQAQMAAN